MKLLLHATSLLLLICAGCAANPAKPADCVIGSVTMRDDRSIFMMLRAEGPDGLIGDAALEYKVGDPDYDKMLSHVGPIEPGEDKFVTCWPDSE
jgi:hypothetical protein